MKIKRFLIAISISFGFSFSLSVHAMDNEKLADEVETPDLLIQETDTKEKNLRYGDKDISISPDARKDKSQIKPDPLEKLLMPEKNNEDLDKKIIQKKKIIKIKSAPKKSTADDEILTPDPLLDMIN